MFGAAAVLIVAIFLLPVFSHLGMATAAMPSGGDPRDDLRRVRALKKKARLEVRSIRSGELDVERLRKGDVNYFSIYYLNKALQPKQRDFCKSGLTNDHTVFVASRQSGKTEAIVILILFVMLFGKNIVMEIYAPTEKQVKKGIFKRVYKALRSHPQLWAQVAPGGYQKGGSLEMLNGNELNIQTANRDSNIRGVTPTHSVLDESQDIPDSKYRTDIMAASAGLDGLDAENILAAEYMGEGQDRDEYLAEVGRETKIWEVGTPRGRNHFSDACLDPTVGAVVIQQPWWESYVVSRRVIAREKRKLPSHEFEQEYCCVFNLDSDFAFPREQLIDALSLDYEDPEQVPVGPQSGAQYVAGVDLGQKVDHTVLTVVQCIGGLRKMVFHYKWATGLKWVQIVEEMNDFVYYWKPKFVLIDRTGPQGKWVFEQYLVWLKWENMDGWEYTPTSKGELMKYLQLLIEEGDVEMWDEESLMREFMSIQEKRLPTSQLPQYPKPDEGKGKDDQVQAVALACMAAAMWTGDIRINHHEALKATQFDHSFMSSTLPNLMGEGIPQRRGGGSGRASPGENMDRGGETSPWSDTAGSSPWSDPGKGGMGGTPGRIGRRGRGGGRMFR